MYLDKIVAHNKKRKDEELELERLREENARLWELVENAHLNFHKLMMFSFGAMDTCERRGDNVGVKTHDRLIEMGRESANELFAYIDEHYSDSEEHSND